MDDKNNAISLCGITERVHSVKRSIRDILGVRANRRFEERPVTDQESSRSHQSSTQRLDSDESPFDLYTNEGLRVLIYKHDITKVHVDAIVNAAGEKLDHGGGVAFAIAEAAGKSLKEECRNYIIRNVKLKTGHVLTTTAGKLPCKFVIHAVGPVWHSHADQKKFYELLRSTFINCLQQACSLRVKSIAIPLISSGRKHAL